MIVQKYNLVVKKKNKKSLQCADIVVQNRGSVSGLPMQVFRMLEIFASHLFPYIIREDWAEYYRQNGMCSGPYHRPHPHTHAHAYCKYTHSRS